MNKYNDNDIEKILERLAKENPKEMDKIDEIDDSVFDRIESNAISEISNIVPEKSTKKKGYMFLKVAAGFAGLFAVFSMALYFFDMPNTRAAENPTLAPNETPHIPAHEMNIPKYIPEGYSLDYIVAEPDYNGYNGYEIKYVNVEDKDLFLLIRVYGEPIHEPIEFEREIEQIEYNDYFADITTVYSEPTTIYITFSDGYGDVVRIVSTLNKDTLLKVMDSMH